MSTKQRRELEKAEQERRDRLRRQRDRERTEQERWKALGYRHDRPNHLIHDSLGDPRTCTENHNHPQHIGE